MYRQINKVNYIRNVQYIDHKKERKMFERPTDQVSYILDSIKNGVCTSQ